MADIMTDILLTMSGNLVALKQIQEGMVTTFDAHFKSLANILARMEANRVQQDVILANQSAMLAKIDEHLARQDAILLRMDEHLARQDEILAKIDEHTAQIAEILSRFDQGRNGR
jgi:uncharacterized coiled-coil DUF342 family protein